eukprot:6646961-Pyramimonas_sp.AAC.1
MSLPPSHDVTRTCTQVWRARSQCMGRPRSQKRATSQIPSGKPQPHQRSTPDDIPGCVEPRGVRPDMTVVP